MSSADGATAGAASKRASSEQPETSASAHPPPGRVGLFPESKTRASNEGDAAAVGGGGARLTVCRFLVKYLRGDGGYAECDVRVDLVRERHGLYDLVAAVFGIMHGERLTRDPIFGHLWDVELAGRRYANGRRSVDPFTMEAERPAGPGDVDHLERRVFSSLATPLRSGQMGSCGGQSLSFDFVVENDAVEEVDEGGINIQLCNPLEIFQRPGPENEQDAPGTPGTGVPKYYPRSMKVPLGISSDLVADWLDAETKQRLASLRLDWSAYLSGTNTWKKVFYRRPPHVYVPAKPDPPRWEGDEVEIIGLLSNSGAKFKKSWTGILQHAFPSRSEGACSMKWYTLRGRERFKIEGVGRGMTDGARVRLAKRLAARRVGDLLERGRPAWDPHPDAHVRSMLRKRGWIDDDTDEWETARLCLEYREYHCAGDADY